MSRPFRRLAPLRALGVAAAAALAWPVPSARAQADTARAEASDAEVDGLPSVVTVGGSELDAMHVKEAIERELGIPLRIDPHAEERLEVVVTGRRANVTYFGKQREPVTRAVDLPHDRERAIQTIAFLAGNLARDEAEGLLEQLRARSSAPPPPLPPPEAAPQPQPPEPAAKAVEPPTVTAPTAAKPKQLEKSVFNLSLYHPLTLLSKTETRHLNLELGLAYSRIGALSGIGMNLGHLRVEGPTVGISYAFLWNRAGPVRGIQLANVFGQGHGLLRGISYADLVNYRDGDVDGLDLAGIFVQARLVRGVQLGGIVAFASGGEGAQIAGIAAYSFERNRGVQLAGIAGVTPHIEGVQLAAIASVARDVSGVQIGLVNVARRVRGVQIGLVNVAERVDGGAIGLVSVAGNGRIQPTAWLSGGADTSLNAGLKFLTSYTYSYVGVGNVIGQNRYRLEAGLGPHLPIAGGLGAELGMSYAYERDPEDAEAEPFRQELRYDARLLFDFFEAVTLYAGGGFNQRLTGAGADFRGQYQVGLSFF